MPPGANGARWVFGVVACLHEQTNEASVIPAAHDGPSLNKRKTEPGCRFGKRNTTLRKKDIGVHESCSKAPGLAKLRVNKVLQMR